MKDTVFAFEFSDITARATGNRAARKELNRRFRVGRLAYKCPACEGVGDAGPLDLCLPCKGTGIAASARYWD